MNQEQIKAVLGRLGEIVDRTKRIETRLVRVMEHLGLDPKSGKAIETPTEKK
jgi:ketopantoate hydroxymethyltransferase